MIIFIVIFPPSLLSLLFGNIVVVIVSAYLYRDIPSFSPHQQLYLYLCTFSLLFFFFSISSILPLHLLIFLSLSISISIFISLFFLISSLASHLVELNHSQNRPLLLIKQFQNSTLVITDLNYRKEFFHKPNILHQ